VDLAAKFSTAIWRLMFITLYNDQRRCWTKPFYNVKNTDSLCGRVLRMAEVRLILELSWSHTMTPQSVGLLWTSDRSVAETTHNTRKETCGIRTHNPREWSPADPRLRPLLHCSVRVVHSVLLCWLGSHSSTFLKVCKYSRPTVWISLRRIMSMSPVHWLQCVIFNAGFV
jgi:hypothetical protein